MPRFSIIVPVYNSEKYLIRCIDSILAQSFSDYELILINDGSTDSSLELCLEAQKNDSRIRIINQVNKGAAAARNAGIVKSSGEYILFVDSDDTVEIDYLKTINDTALEYSEPDIIEFKLHFISADGHKIVNGTVLQDGLYDRDYIQRFFLPIMLRLEESPLCYTVYNVLRAVNRRIVQQGVLFNEKQLRWEDFLFAIKAFDLASCFAVNTKPIYNYYGHVGGGLGGKYDMNTYKYVFEAYSCYEQLFSHKLNMNTDYAVSNRLGVFQHLINEVFANEKSNAAEEIITSMISHPYFLKTVKLANGNEKLLQARKHLLKGNTKKAVKILRQNWKLSVFKVEVKSRAKKIIKRLLLRK